MAISPPNTQRFSTESVCIATFAKALAHPARVEILLYLAKQNSCICGDIVSALPLSQSTVSQHLSELKSAGLIKGTIDGPKVCYCLDAEGIAEGRALLDGTLDALTQSTIKTSAACC
jgi:DNA-binding transcriptional ArsR family regulator